MINKQIESNESPVGLFQDQFLLNLWNNPESREQFLSEPRKYLEQQGLTVSDRVKLFAHADAPGLRHYVLPADELPLSEDSDPFAQIISKAFKDSAFKSELLNDSHAAAAKIGITLPKDMDIRFLENTPDEIHLVLPINPSISELSDADLDMVAGGRGFTNQEERDICTAAAGGAGVGCGVMGFTTPVAGAVSSFGVGASGLSSAIAANV